MFWYENISDLTAFPLFPIIFNVTCNWLNKIAFSGFSLYYEWSFNENDSEFDH